MSPDYRYVLIPFQLEPTALKPVLYQQVLLALVLTLLFSLFTKIESTKLSAIYVLYMRERYPLPRTLRSGPISYPAHLLSSCILFFTNASSVPPHPSHYARKCADIEVSHRTHQDSQFNVPPLCHFPPSFFPSLLPTSKPQQHPTQASVRTVE